LLTPAERLPTGKRQHRATERGSDERPVRSPRNLRLIHEMGELAANQPLEQAA
jgi:hypothetical protein